MQWKNFEEFFHSVENFFPQCGKTSSREPPHPGRPGYGRSRSVDQVAPSRCL